MSPISHPYFSLQGDFDPDEITRVLSIQPSSVKRIGDPGPPDALGPRLGAEWIWQPDDDDSDHVGDQLAFMAGVLSLAHEIVAELSKKFFGTLNVYNQVDGVNRDWFVSGTTLRILADLHVDVECKSIRLTQVEESKKNAN